jgi:hypothetical protein
MVLGSPERLAAGMVELSPRSASEPLRPDQEGRDDLRDLIFFLSVMGVFQMRPRSCSISKRAARP